MLRHRRLGVLVALFLSIWTAVAAAAPFVYISNSGSGTISVVDTATNAVTGTIPLPAGAAPWAVATNPANNSLYVTNFANGALYVIDLAAGSLVTTVPIGMQPIGVAVNAAGTRVYVTNHLTFGPGIPLFSGSLTVVDANTNTVLTSLVIGRLPIGVAVHPSGNPVYVALSNGVAIFDTVANAVTGVISVGNRPFGLALSPSGQLLYVSNQFSNTVTVISTATHTQEGEVAVGQSPQGIAVNADGSRVYVANRDSNNVSVIDTSTNTLAGLDIPVGPSPYGVQMSADGRFVYVANSGNRTVSVIDTVSNSVTALTVGNTPIGFGISVRPASRVGTTLTLTVDPGSVIVGASTSVILRVVLTRRDNGAPLSGASVAFSMDGSALGSATTDGSGSAGWTLNPSALGVGAHTALAAFAQSAIGGVTFEASSASRPLAVIYRWLGWKPPVAGNALNPANAGSTISMRWAMMDANGNPIRSLDAVAGIDTALIACAGDGIIEVSAAAGTGGNGLHMDGASQQFQFNWKTDKSWAGQCRAFIVRLADGTTRMAKFHFR